MKSQFHCPYQTSETFSFEQCLHCGKFEMLLGEHMSAHCRANSKDSACKLNFQASFYANRIGVRDDIEIIP